MSNAIFPYENLANAIILRAADDYREVLRKWNRHPQKEEYRLDKASIERFFRSAWFGVLTGLDPELLIERLNMEVAA